MVTCIESGGIKVAEDARRALPWMALGGIVVLGLLSISRLLAKVEPTIQCGNYMNRRDLDLMQSLKAKIVGGGDLQKYPQFEWVTDDSLIREAHRRGMLVYLYVDLTEAYDDEVLGYTTGHDYRLFPDSVFRNAYGNIERTRRNENITMNPHPDYSWFKHIFGWSTSLVLRHNFDIIYLDRVDRRAYDYAHNMTMDYATEEAVKVFKKWAVEHGRLIWGNSPMVPSLARLFDGLVYEFYGEMEEKSWIDGMGIKDKVVNLIAPYPRGLKETIWAIDRSVELEKLGYRTFPGLNLDQMKRYNFYDEVKKHIEEVYNG